MSNSGKPPKGAIHPLGFSALRSDNFRFAWPILAILIVCDLSFSVYAQEADGPSAFAGVFDAKYRDAPEDLQLEKSGVDRAAALSAYFKALHYERRGDSARAISSYEEVLKLAPGNPTIARRAAEMIFAAGAGIEGGKNLLEAALAAAPKNPEAKLHLSAFLAAHGDSKDRSRAIDLAVETVNEFPDHPEALEHYVGLRLASGQKSTAALLIKKLAVREDISSARFWLAMARASELIWPQKKGDAAPLTPAAKVIRGRIDGFYAHALRLEPENPMIVEEAGSFFRDTGRLASTAQVYEKLLEKRADLLNERFYLATLYRDLDRKDDALRELERLAKIDPRRPDVRVELTELYQASGDLAKAIPHAEELIRIQGGTEWDLVRLGNLLEEAGLQERWLAHARRVVEIYPKSAHGGFMLGNALLKNGQFKESAEVFRRSVIYCQAYDRSRLDTEYYSLFGEALSKSGDLENAEVTLMQALDSIPRGSPVVETVPVLTALAEVQYSMGKRDEAVANLRRAVSADPRNKELVDRLKSWESNT